MTLPDPCARMAGAGELGMRDGAAHMNLDGGVEGVERDVFQWRRRRRGACVVHQNVQPAVGIKRLFDRALGIRHVARVGLDEGRAGRRGDRLATIDPPSGKDNLGALLDKPLDDPMADAGGAAGDDGDLVL